MTMTGSINSAAAQARTQNRGEHVLEMAARLFNARGLDGASMRDIAQMAGIRASSLYHFFPGKEQLFLAVYTEGVRRISAAVESALQAEAAPSDPWGRLETASVAHLETLLAGDDFAALVIRTLPSADSPSVADINKLRNDYEAIFRGLVAALPGVRPADRRLLRLGLLGALNWSTAWYRADGENTPATIARRIVAWLRHGVEDGGLQ